MEFVEDMMGKTSGRRRGLVGLCRAYPAELEIALIAETALILIMLVVFMAQLYCICKKCCRPKPPRVQILTAVKPVQEEEMAMMPKSPLMLREELRTDQEMPRCTFNFTIPNFNPFQNMQPF